MDSYDLFGEDGSGMLDGLPELGSDHFEPAVTGTRNATSAYSQPAYSQETPLQKLASFGGTDFNHMDPNAQAMYAQGYGTDRPMGPPGSGYGHQRQMGRPPPAPPQTANPTQYPYQTDNMYSMPDHQLGGMNDANNMQAGWGQHPAAASTNYPMHRYSQMGGYRQQMSAYQQETQKQQFHPMMQQPHQPAAYQMQQRHTPHYPQTGAGYPTPAASQGYGGYMHQRLPQHHQYPHAHHQMEMGAPQAQQYNQMGHAQSLPGHPVPVGNVPHNVGAAPSHMNQSPHPGHPGAHPGPPNQPPAPQNPMVAPPHPSQMGYGQTHQSMQGMQQQRGVDVQQSAQYPNKHAANMGNSSPQYRAPFPQLSPQMSPRSQMSPRPPQGPQMSPRPVMSPAKPNMSPHPQMQQQQQQQNQQGQQQANLSPRPATSLTPKSGNAGSSPAAPPIPAYSQQSTLQALEQMVMPPASSNSNAVEYPQYSRNNLVPPQPSQTPLSPPVMGMRNQMSANDWGNTQQQQQQPPPPTQPRQPPSHSMQNMNGMMGMMEQQQQPPQTPHNQNQMAAMQQQQQQPQPPQSIPTTQTLPTNAQHTNLTNQNMSFNFDGLQPAIKENANTLVPPELQMNAHKDFAPAPSVAHSVQSPTNSLPDKQPSSTTNSELSVPYSTSHQQQNTSPHPPTPTPSSTTDDNNMEQNARVPPATTTTAEPKPDETNENVNIEQPTQSKTKNNFGDFNCVSSMTSGYSEPNTPKTVTKMDDLVQSNAATTFAQENSSSQDSITDSSSNHATDVSQSQSNLSNIFSGIAQQQQSQPAKTPPLSNVMSNQITTSRSSPNASQTNNIVSQTTNFHGSQDVLNAATEIPTQNTTSTIAAAQNAAIATPQVAVGANQTQAIFEQNAGRNQQHMIQHTHTILPHQDFPGYQPPISHHQERAALQQQLQELYCMPPGPSHQEKIAHLQERLNVLSQHEATEQCNGGPNCVLQSPLFTSPMIDSPQVTSTTGRGRPKGVRGAKKPRQRKGEKAASPIQMSTPTMTPQLLPVSEDCVTPGTGLSVPVDEPSDMIDMGLDVISDEFAEKKKRKPRGPNKSKLKDSEAEESRKERKKRERETKDPNSKRRRKKKSDVILDESSNEPLSKSKSVELEESVSPSEAAAEGADEINDDSKSEDKILISDSTTADQNETEAVVDSQTPDDVPEKPSDAPAKDEYAFEDTPSSPQELSEMPRKKRSRGSSKKSGSSRVRNRNTSGGGGSKTKRRRGPIVPESDGENDDMAASPPPSPVDDDGNKRRSARNTQRKKYTDDVMLRFSDDDSPVVQTSKKKSSAGPAPPVPVNFENEENAKSDNANKPNFVYVNTTEEDSMVVQHVLASRTVKRPKKPEEKPNPKPKVEGEAEGESDETKPETQTENLNTNSNDDENKTEKPVKNESKEKIEDDPVEKEEVKPEIKEDATPIENEDKNKIKDKDEDGGDADGDEKEEQAQSDSELEEVEEYYVKYRNFSYLHCEWKTEEELFKGDKRISNKIKRFKQKQAQQLNIFENLEDEPFNPDYVEVERVLDVAVHTDPITKETVKHYLVKWRSLQYEDCTWELEEDVDPIKIEQYERFNKLPPKDQWKPRKKPGPDEWKKLEKSPIYKGGNVLREYQLEGLNWLLFSWYNGRNCILADEMGLGKTIQSLTFLHAAYDYGMRGPFLVIAPLSTIPNWQREIEGWTDMNVIVYHGSAASKNMLQEYEMFYKTDSGKPIKDLTKFNILITTFEIIVNDFADLKGFNWRICVIDEAHRLKNRNCKLLDGLRQLTLEHRVLLSGTPLQNNVNELFSLLNFLEPEQFASCEQFLTEFGALKSETEVQKLQCLLKPMMLRRLKEDVEKSLAPKEETVVEVELTNIQKKYYRGILERNFSFLSKGTTNNNLPNLMNTMMELRKCCIHPYLLNGAEDQIQYDFKMSQGDDPDAYYKSLIHSSGKMVLIDKLLPKLRANGHRVLIFSQMVRCLDILEDYLMYRKYPFERIDGRIRGNLRQAAIDRFSRPDSDRFVFLLCTKAGGLGINLTAADTVIIYDSDWNPQNDLQAQARCHRIGQQKMVKIYRLLCRNTYEREMFDKASLKLGLDKAVLQSMNTSQGGKDSNNGRQLSKKEIEDLLKKGAYGALLDEENDGDKFCEEDIDVILARRTQVITMESEKGSTFSKASFASSANRTDINVDDPDFWNKWAKKAEIDTTEKDESEDLVLSEPRRRTQIKRYGHDESAIDMSDLESSSDSDAEIEGIPGMTRSRRSKLKKKKVRDDYYPREGEKGEIVYGSWARRECFMVERGLLTFGWGRWNEILQNSQLRKGWKENDVEDCARVILLYCLRFYRGDEKIRSFVWDLITPGDEGKVSKNHQGLKDPVPRGIRNKNKKKNRDNNPLDAIEDPGHWSKDEKYDGDIFLESNYKKHLGRHANKVLLRVRMLYYIKHEIIGDLVQHINDGVHASALPINPPQTDQLPAEWWDGECDKSLLVGTLKHGYENYTAMRADPYLCFLSRCGPPSDRDLQMLAASNMQPSTPSTALNDDDGEEDENDEKKLMKDDDLAEPSPGPSASSETPNPEGEDGESNENDKQWPSVTDLNTRLRRVITSYQRSYRKEEQKMATSKMKTPIEPAMSSPLAALAQVSQQFDGRDATALGLPGWDLQQLALYLLKMERQGKQAMEQALREKERSTIGRKWSKREEADFFRVASSYGVIYFRKRKTYDWGKLKQLAKLERKTDDELTEYYKHFVMMCKKQTGLPVEDGSYDQSIEHISEEKARRTLERLELLSRIREEIVTHQKLDERLSVCVTSADMPDWWIAGKHDKDLLLGVAKHGLGRTDYYLLDDPELSFHEILRKKVNNTESKDTKDAIKLESHEDILKFDKDEILVKLEKGEGTLKIEKVVKKEAVEEKKEEPNKIEMTLVKSEEAKEETSKEKEVEEKPIESDDKKEHEANTESETSETKPTVVEETKVEDEEKEAEKTDDKTETEEKAAEKDEKMDEKEVAEAETKTETEPKKPETTIEEKPAAESSESEKKPLEKSPTKTEEPEKPEKPEKPGQPKNAEEENNDLCSKQAAELKAMFPDLEVIQPLSRLSQIDTFVLRDKQGSGALDFSETTVAQLFNNAVKWPKEYAIQVRLQHIIYAVETKEWPASKSFSAYATGIGNEFDIPIHELPNDPPKRETSTPMSISESENVNSSKKRKRHIAIDVETERAKLHALLNSTCHLGNPMKHMGWGDNEDSEDSRRSTPVQSTLQPPPAHQQASRMMGNLSGSPYDLKYHSPIAKTIGQTTVIPGTSSTLTPIDLSSSVPKSDRSSSDMGEAQDFSMPSKKSSSKIGGNKLDDTLSKLMKRKNCPEPEPLVGKEKKRKKLDEIVLGLSAAKEQSLFPEPTKKPQIPPSVTLTPTSAPVSTSHSPSQKPFTITVTSVPSSSASRNSSLPNLMPSIPSSSKDSFSSFLAQAEQQNLLLKKQQQQQRKSYEAMIGDISKVSEYSSKVNSFSHEAKVNKWLAEQNAALNEQSLGGSADYMSQRRRRPRVDPTLLDWKKLTGDENVSVIHRVTGKKLTGPKAPTLKRLGQWLMENPMYDIDPKWSELVKERGNLSHDLQKRVQNQSGSSKKLSGSSASLMQSPTGSASSNSSNLPFPSLSSAGLGGLNSNLLSGLSGLAQFDPKNNPLLMPFAGLPNMSALGSMGGLGNLNNMNLFANLAGLGLPGLGMDPSALAAAAAAATAGSETQKSSKSGSKKPQDAHSSSSKSSNSSGGGGNNSNNSNIPTSTNPFPFFFPNPSLLYTPLGLGGLNPFTLQPGMSAAYDTLAQQCGLLNGGNLNPAASPKSSKSSSSSRPSSSSSTSMSSSSKPRTSSTSSSRDAHLQQLLLPPDTQILESITKAASSLDASLKQMKSDKKEDKRKALESLRGMLPTDFTSPDNKLRGDKKELQGLSDFTKLLEAQVSQTAKKTHEQQMKEALEQLSKNNAELMIAKAFAAEDSKIAAAASTPKRARESTPEASPTIKKHKKEEEKTPSRAATSSSSSTPASHEQEGIDIETLLPPSTVVKRSPEKEVKDKKEATVQNDEGAVEIEENNGDVEEKKGGDVENASNEEQQQSQSSSELESSPPKKSAKRTRGKRKSGDLPPIDPESVREKKNLRSSASRSAAAAAARAAAAEHAAAKAEAEKHRNESSECGSGANSDA